MSAPAKHQIVAELLDRHGRTYAADVRNELPLAMPAPLFQLVCLSLLRAGVRREAAPAARRFHVRRGG